MASRSRASFGCQECRARKIKCDETRPVCSRCTRTGVRCVYRDAFELVHRDQTSTAARQAREKWRKRVNDRMQTVELNISTAQDELQSADSTLLGNKHTSEISSATSSDGLMIGSNGVSRTIEPFVRMQAVDEYPHPQTPPRQNLQELAFMRFRFDFLDPPDRAYSRRGTLEMVPSLCLQLPRGDVLVLAVSAVSLADYGARMHSAAIVSQARNCYVRALNGLKATTSDPRKATKVETLLSAYILSLYEALTNPDHNSSYLAHLEGSESLMKLMADSRPDRYRQIISENAGFGVLLLKHAIFRHLAYYIRPPPWLERLILDIPTDGIKADLVRIAFQATIVCSNLKGAQTCIAYGKPLKASPLGMLQEAASLDATFQNWSDEVPADLQLDSYKICAAERKVLWVRDLFARSGAPYDMDIVRSSWRVHEWNMYHITRLNLVCCMLDLQEILLSHGLNIDIDASAAREGQEEEDPTKRMYTRDLLEADVNVAVTTAVRIIQSALRSIPHALGVEPPSPATLISLPSLDARRETAAPADPGNLHEVTGLRGYHVVWLCFNVLKSCNRPRLRCAETIEIESWVKHFFKFLWNDLGIAQAEAYRRWYEQGLPAGF